VKIVEKVFGAILKIIVLIIDIAIWFTESIKGVLKILLEFILFLLLLVTCPIWILPYTTVLKKKKEKYERKDK
jgi:hypothetical protein